MINYGKVKINNKDICIVEEHHHVLEYWTELREILGDLPIVITLDHHTDTRTAFTVKICEDNNYIFPEDWEQKSYKMVSNVNLRNKNELKNMFTLLRNDEHIDFAIKGDIISECFIIAYRSDIDQGKIHPLENTCYIGCNKESHDDDCSIIHWNQAIESILLQHKLSLMNDVKSNLVVNNIITENYILDIDLDYFHTIQSIHPKDTEVFYKLIRNASMITIATEPFYVNEWKNMGHELDDNFNSEYLLNQLLCHIEQALK